MGAVGGLFGTSGGAAGTGFAKPQAANITNPVSIQQIQQANAQAQQGVNNQQGLIAATQPGGQQALQSQQQLLQQLGKQAQGQGPIPALNQLNQYTGQNVANQNALMAGQRGSSANTGLIARQAAQQGAATQQQAVGQGATLAAQQQLGAQQNLAGLQGQLYGQQAGAVTGYNQAAQQEQANLLGAQGAYNQAQVNMQSNINSANAGLASTSMQGQQGLIGGGLNAIGGLFAQGGQVQNYWPGGTVQNDGSQPSAFASFLNQNYGNPGANALAQGFNKFGSSTGSAIGSMFSPSAPATNTATQAGGPGSYISPDMAKGGKVPAMVSPGEKYLAPNKVEAVKQGANPMDIGDTVPGKPKVKGAKDSYKNDTIPADLDEGGIVIPRSITQGPNAHWESMKFVHKTLKKSKTK